MIEVCYYFPDFIVIFHGFVTIVSFTVKCLVEFLDLLEVRVHHLFEFNFLKFLDLFNNINCSRSTDFGLIFNRGCRTEMITELKLIFLCINDRILLSLASQ